MKCTTWLLAVLFTLVIVQGAWAAREGGGKPYQVCNRLRVEYDDNIYQTDSDKENSWKIIEEVEG